jgi:hypothetical protein
MGQATAVTKALGGFDPKTTFDTTDEFGQTVTHSIQEVITRVTQLLANLAAAMASGSEKARQAALRAWQNYGPTVAAAISAGNQQAQAAIDAGTTAFQSAFGRVQQRILTAFDRQTQRGLAAMQAGFQARMDKVAQDYAKRIAAVQKRFAAQIKKVEAEGQALTPAEAQLKALTEGHEGQALLDAVSSARDDLQKAQQGGDPAEILAAQKALNEALYSQQVASLQKLAEAERTAKDAATQKLVEAMQEQEQVVEQRLNEELAAKQAAMQAEEAIAEQNYQDQRDNQRTALEDQLTDWGTALINKTKTMAEFLDWLNGEMKPGGLLEGVTDIPSDPVAAAADGGHKQGSAFADGFITEIERAITKLNELYKLMDEGPNGGSGDGTGMGTGIPGPEYGGDYQHPTHYAVGGIVPGGGVGDTVSAMVSPGELILTRAMQRQLAGALMTGGGGGVTVNIHDPVFLEGDKATARKLAIRLDTELSKVIKANY